MTSHTYDKIQARSLTLVACKEQQAHFSSVCSAARCVFCNFATKPFLNFDIKDRGRALPQGVIIHNCSKAHDQISRLAHACRDATKSEYPEATKNESHHNDLASTSSQKGGGLTAIVPCCLPCIRSQQLCKA